MNLFPGVKDRNKIVLVFPKLDPRESRDTKAWEPISIISLAGHLIKRGFSVEIYDSRIREDFAQVIARDRDQLLCVGISAMAGYQVVEGYNFSKDIKERFPELPVIWGGWFPTLSPDQCLDSPYIDIVVKGQGERLLPELAQNLKTCAGIDDMTGISFKSNGKIIHNQVNPLQDLNDFLPVNYELIDISQYKPSDGFLHYITSVGCPYNCTFCGVSTILKRKWYGLEAERVVREIKAMHDKYDIKNVVFFDSTLFVNLNRAKDMLKGFLRENLQFKWLANSYVNQVVNFDDELLDLLKATNCSCIELGIESGSARMRELYQKNFSDENILRALDRLAKINVAVRANYIIAPPMERKEDFMATVRSMAQVKEKNPENIVVMYQYTAIPGTKLAEYEKEENKSVLPENIEGWRGYYTQMSEMLTLPWLNKKDEMGRQPVLFYFKTAFMNTQRYNVLKAMPLRLLQKIAAFRLRHEVFLFPFEWNLFRIFTKRPFSK